MIVAVVMSRYPAERYSLHRGYVDALLSVGATPVLVAPSPVAPDITERTLDLVDAVLVSGGGDIDPSCYGGPTVPSLMELDAVRDSLELAAVSAAARSGRKVLGICRGAQLLAVAAGGTLVPDLPSAGHPGHWREDLQYEAVHPVEAEDGSLAAAALGGAREVNTIHHQAVADPGSLRATAWSPDGVIEAVEGPGVLGVQWHPERLMAADPRHLAPFRWLVEP